MNRYRWIGWLTAIILVFSLLAPVVGTIEAQAEEELTPSAPTTVVEDQEGDDELIPSTPTTVVEDELLNETTSEEPAAASLLSRDTENSGELDELGVQEPDISGSIKVFFEDQYGDPIEGAGFALYVMIDGTCATAPIDSLVTDANGVVIFLGIDPAATYCVVLESVPTGYENATGWSWTVTPADTNDDLSPLDAVLYLGIAKLGGGELEAGKVTILKYYCEASGPEFQRVIFDLFEYEPNAVAADSLDSLECAPGWARFWIEPLGKGEGFFAETDVTDGSTVITDLPSGMYEITETAPWESGTFVFEVFENGVTTIAVQNFYYEGDSGEGALEIQKYYCPGKSVWTEFLVEEVSVAHEKCEPGKASFVLFPYFAGEGIPLQTNDLGYLLLEEVPEGTHLIMEKVTETTYAVTIVDGQTTRLVVINHYVPGPPDDGDQKPPVTHPEKEPVGGVVVEQLPSTGTGSTADESLTAMIAGSLVAVVVIAALRLRPWLQLR